MGHLQRCALALEHLLNIDHHIIIGRKGKSMEPNILSDPIKLRHLVGLHKLRDLHVVRANRERVFQNYPSGTFSIQDLMRSRYFPEIEKRIQPFNKTETSLNSSQLVFRYSKKLRTFPLIEAKYLLSMHLESTGVYILLDQLSEEDQFLYRSLFPKEKKDYTIEQPQFTLLFKEKIMVSTGKKIIQYDWLAPENKPASTPPQEILEKEQAE